MPHSHSASIGDLLGESPEAARMREKEMFQGQLRPTDGTVVLFGAGRLGRLCARALRAGNVPLRAYCDRNPSLQGGVVEGAPVLSPEKAAARFGARSLFVVAIWTGTARESMTERLAYLRGIGCRHAASHSQLLWAHGRAELPFHSFDLPSETLRHAPALRELAASLSDEASAGALLAVLRQRLWGEYDERPPSPDQYFPAGILNMGRDESFADGGAFDGDTLDDFLGRTGGRFAAYHAFEPDPSNFERLLRKASLLPQEVQERISLHRAALSAADGTVGFSGRGDPTSNIAAGSSNRVEGRTLDSLFAGKNLTFLKLDVEGGERDALLGARATIARCRPFLAVCAYHQPADLWELPALLREMLPGHLAFLRQHQFDGYELVYYAQPRR